MSKVYNDIRCRMKRCWCGFTRFCGDEPWAVMVDALGQGEVGGLGKRGVGTAPLEQVGWLCTSRSPGPLLLMRLQPWALPWESDETNSHFRVTSKVVVVYKCIYTTTTTIVVTSKCLSATGSQLKEILAPNPESTDGRREGWANGDEGAYKGESLGSNGTDVTPQRVFSSRTGPRERSLEAGNRVIVRSDAAGCTRVPDGGEFGGVGSVADSAVRLGVGWLAVGPGRG